jgi:hypothetical protein
MKLQSNNNNRDAAETTDMQQVPSATEFAAVS